MADRELLLSVASNPLRSAVDRRIAWDCFEREAWYHAVHRGDLRVCDLEERLQEPVYKLIIERAQV